MTSQDPQALTFGFVRGTAPGKWEQRWRGTGNPPLQMVALPDVFSPADRAPFDALLERVPPGAKPAGSGGQGRSRHAVRLYAEAPALVVGADPRLNPGLAPGAEVDAQALSLVPLVGCPGMPECWAGPAPAAVARSVQDALELVAAAAGGMLLPLPLARHLADKHRHLVLPVSAEMPGTEIWVTWAVERDDSTIQHLVGILRGRTPRSSRTTHDSGKAAEAHKTRKKSKKPRGGTRLSRPRGSRGRR